MTGAPQQHVDLSAGAAAVLVKGEAQGAMEQIKQQLAAHSGPTGSLLGTGVQKEDRCAVSCHPAPPLCPSTSRAQDQHTEHLEQYSVRFAGQIRLGQRL